MATLIAILKLTLFFLWTFTLIPFQAMVVLTGNQKLLYILPQLYHRVCCRIFLIKIETEGTPITDKQVLYVSNHISYFDISVISSVIPVSFIAKADVKDWPLFGLLAQLQRTAFVSRNPRKAKQDNKSLSDALRTGRNLCLFAEGTSTRGYSVEMFKPTLFELEDDLKKDLWVQPITLKVLETNGKVPQSDEEQDLYAWGREIDTPLFAHKWRMAKSRGARIMLSFHPAFVAEKYADRKVLAAYCHDQVLSGIKKATA